MRTILSNLSCLPSPQGPFTDDLLHSWTLGLRVSRLTLGAMTFGLGDGIWKSIAGLGYDWAMRLVRLAVERGA